MIKSASQDTANYLKEYLDECSQRERWPESQRVLNIVAERFAPVVGIPVVGMSELKFLKEEIARLKAGDFTPEELQDLCHNLNEKDEKAFCQGCAEYQRKLFGKADIDRLSESEAFFAKLISQLIDEFLERLRKASQVDTNGQKEINRLKEIRKIMSNTLRDVYSCYGYNNSLLMKKVHNAMILE